MESKPAQQHDVVAIPPEGALPESLGGNGDGRQAAPTIDEQSRQTAMARAMIENERHAREQRCGAEIDAAIQSILRRNNCSAEFRELRQGGNTTRIWLQPIALDEPIAQ